MNGTLTTFEPLLPGVAGTAQTLDKMRAQVQSCVVDPLQRVRLAVEAIARAAGVIREGRAEVARCLYDFVLERIGYLEDPSDLELAKHPHALLRDVQELGRGYGDCNNHSALMAALGHSVRLPMVWVIEAPLADPDAYQHIYACMILDELQDLEPDNLLALDTGNRSPGFGRHTPLTGADAIAVVVPSFLGA